MAAVERPNLLLAGLAFGMVALLAALYLPNPLTTGWDELRLGPDDALRIVEVRDLLAGQGWFDPHQHRMGLDRPVPMHWSRAVDAPLAALYGVFRIVTGPEQAERAAAAVWPLVLAFLWIWLSLALARRLAGGAGVICGALFLLPLALVEDEFRPGRVDHHNLQLVLLLLVALLLADGQRSVWRSALAGIAAALSLAVGLETLPALAAVSGVVALHWALEPGQGGQRLALGFGLGLSGGVVAALFLLLAPTFRYTPYCDQLSLATAAPAIIGGGGLALAAGRLEAAGRGVRLGALLLLAGASLAVVGFAFPECLAGPYGQITAEMEASFQSIVERRSLMERLRTLPGVTVYVAVLWPLAGLTGLACAAWALPAERRVVATSLLAMALLAVLVSWAEARGQRFSRPLTLFGGVWALAWMVNWRGYWRLLKPLAIAVLLVLMTPFGFLMTPGFSAQQPGTAAFIEQSQKLEDCISDVEMEPLETLPPGRILSRPGFGSHVLLTSRHHSITGTYHRNVDGYVLYARLRPASADEARRLLADARVDYLLFCHGYDDRDVLPASLLQDIAQGRPPDWLEPVSGNRMRVYRVRD